MNRRRFAFIIGMWLFWMAEKVGATWLDQIATAAMRAVEQKATTPGSKPTPLSKKSNPSKEEIRGKAAQTGEPQQDKEIPVGPTHPDPIRRARHGRPPSKWLRSLQAAELREWMNTIEVPEAGVEGMTYWDHLIEDHRFDPLNITGLTAPELAKLHGVAHFGY